MFPSFHYSTFRRMNIHHLELFYFVARHGGIAEAVRNIPYGIQQPAVSGQVAQLEEYLGVTLFQRRPFALTPAGERLYRFIQPFFSGLDGMASELQGGKARQIRIGASTTVLRDHLPELFQSVRKKFPNLKIGLLRGRGLWHRPFGAGAQRQDIAQRADLAVAGLCAGDHGSVVARQDLGAAASVPGRASVARQAAGVRDKT